MIVRLALRMRSQEQSMPEHWAKLAGASCTVSGDFGMIACRDTWARHFALQSLTLSLQNPAALLPPLRSPARPQPDLGHSRATTVGAIRLASRFGTETHGILVTYVTHVMAGTM